MDVGLAWKRNAERSAASNAFHDFMHLAVGSDQP